MNDAGTTDASTDAQTRKLQKVGGSTYTVSVPKRWAREHGLEAGDDIHLYGHGDGSLVVRSEAVDGGDLDAVTVAVEDPDPDPDRVERWLRAAYATGFEEFDLVADDGFGDDERRTAESVAKTLVGAEVVEASADRLAVRTLLDPADVSVRQSLAQLQFVALTMHREATVAVTDGRTADHIPGRDDEVDRLFAMIAHHFDRSLVDFEELDSLGLGRSELFEYYVAARQLERVADHAVEIARVAESLDGAAGDERAVGDGERATGDDENVADEIAAVADAARQVVEDATDAVLDGDAADAAHAALDLRDETVADAEAVDRALYEHRPDDAYRLSRVVDSLARTAEYGGNVAEIALQSAMRDGT